jgi:hypothetical protein
MDITTFLILSLAVWRISSLLTNPAEHGPYDILDRFREWLGVKYEGETGYAFNELGEVLLCLWCTSIWIGIIITILWLIVPVYTTCLCLPLALSAIAILFEEKR